MNSQRKRSYEPSAFQAPEEPDLKRQKHRNVDTVRRAKEQTAFERLASLVFSEQDRLSTKKWRGRPSRLVTIEGACEEIERLRNLLAFYTNANSSSHSSPDTLTPSKSSSTASETPEQGLSSSSSVVDLTSLPHQYAISSLSTHASIPQQTFPSNFSSIAHFEPSTSASSSSALVPSFFPSPLQTSYSFSSAFPTDDIFGLPQNTSSSLPHHEEKQLQRTQHQEPLLSVIFSSASVSILVMDTKQMKIVDVNEHFLSMSGFTRENFLGFKVTENPIFPEVEEWIALERNLFFSFHSDNRYSLKWEPKSKPSKKEKKFDHPISVPQYPSSVKSGIRVLSGEEPSCEMLVRSIDAYGNFYHTRSFCYGAGYDPVTKRPQYFVTMHSDDSILFQGQIVAKS